MSLCEGLTFRLGHCREVCAFGSDDPSRNVGMMGFQVFFQEVGGVAFSSGVTDEDDLIRRSDSFRDLLIKRNPLRVRARPGSALPFDESDDDGNCKDRKVAPCVRLLDDFHRNPGKHGQRGGR